MEYEKFYFNNSGGIDVQDSPFTQEDNEFVHVQNYIINEAGVLEKRPGTKLVNIEPITEDGVKQQLHGLHQHTDSDGNRHLLGFAGTKVYKLDTDSDTFEVISGGTGFTAGQRYTVVSWVNATQDYVIFSNGTDAIYAYNADTEVIDVLSADEDVPSTASVLYVWQNYLWVAKPNDPKLYRSATNDSTDWDTSDFINTQSEINPEIIGIIGSYPYLYVTHRDSVDIINFQLGSIYPWTFRTIVKDKGVIARSSLSNAGDAASFLGLSEHGFAFFSGANSPVISSKIDAVLNSIDNLDYDNAVAVKYSGSDYPRDQYLISIPLLGKLGLRPEKNNIVLSYFIRQNAWHIFTGLNISVFALGEDATTDREILYFGDYTGNVWQYDPGNTYSDDTNPIATELIKVFDLGSPERVKNFKALYTFYKADTNTSLSLRYQDILNDFNRTSKTTTISLSAEGSSTKSIYTGLVQNFPHLSAQVGKIEVTKLNAKGRYLELRLGESGLNSRFKILGFGIKYSFMGKPN